MNRKGVRKGLQRKNSQYILKLYTFDEWSSKHVPNWIEDRTRGTWIGLCKGWQCEARLTRQACYFWNKRRNFMVPPKER